MRRQAKIAPKNKQYVKEEVKDKAAVFECLVEIPVVLTTPEQLESRRYNRSPFVDVEKIEQKNIKNVALCTF